VSEVWCATVLCDTANNACWGSATLSVSRRVGKLFHAAGPATERTNL